MNSVLRTRSTRLVAAVAVALAGLTTLVVEGVNQASASTLNGIATTASPAGQTFLASGGSDTNFTVTLPTNAACTGDSAHSGYHVWSYLVEKGANIAATTFNADTGPSQGLGLYESDANYYGPANTAQTTGEIIGIPNDFQWGAAVAGGDFTAAQLLYNGGASGVWEGGIACANGSGVLSDNWNTEITFTSSNTDPNGFTWSAVPGPSGSAFAAITSANSATFTEGTTGSFTPTATGNPTPTVTETGALPAGVTFSGGVLSGDPTVTGTFPITVKATNGIGNPATQGFTLTVDAAPAITSGSSAAFTTGTAGSFTVTATGAPTPSLVESGALPSGVTFTDNGNGTGTLGGTPAVGSDGTYDLTLTATNGVGSPATQSFALTVTSAPAITSADNTAFTVGTAGSFTVTTGGSPTPAITESGALPSGVTFKDNGDGTATLAGTPAAGTGGSYDLTLTAANGVTPNATQPFVLSVDVPPSITSADSTTFTAGSAGTFTVTTGTDFPTATTLAESGGLPSGVTFHDNGDGTATLAGTPEAGTGGTYDLTLTAANGVAPNATQSFTLTVDEAPSITSADGTTFTTGTAGTFTVTTGTDFPTATTLAESGGLPSGVAFHDNGNGTATLAGTPAAGTGGSYDLTLTAANGVAPEASQPFVLTVDQPAVITSADGATFSHGVAGSFTVVATGTPAPTITEWGNLPAGVTFSAGALSGTPTVTGTFEVTFTASNGVGTPSTQDFTLTVLGLNITTTSVPGAAPGTPYSYTLQAVGGTTPYKWKVISGTLPKGIKLSAGGVLAGTVSARKVPDPGSYPFTVRVTDHTKKVHETATASFTLQYF
jgi:large repetitive protein